MASLLNISPIDGRYAKTTQMLKPLCSEFGFIKLRVYVECEWLKTVLKLFKKPSSNFLKFLKDLADNFSLADAEQVKTIEQATNHDVKAIEYFLRHKLEKHREGKKYIELIHFACSSEDINNIAYALMVKELRDRHLLPLMKKVILALQALAQQYVTTPMLARTHGQIASPTTMGKELMNSAVRLKEQYREFAQIKIKAKCNGSVGNFNAHYAAYPNIDWIRVCRNFVQQFGLTWNLYTTQIEPHDYLAELSDANKRFNNILIDLSRDIWKYIAVGYFKQKMVAKEIGSSVMPHKINPIDFENAEGNLGMANALLQHFSNKLLISRWQRDLSDSTVLRNIGASFAYALIAYQSLLKGLNKLEVNREQLTKELKQHWEVLAEAIQTTMRRFGIKNSYEKLKAITRGNKVNRQTLHRLIRQLPIPNATKKRLLKLTPENYLGISAELL